MRIYLTPCESGENAWHGDHDSLQQLALIADVKRHEIVDNPKIADAVLITDLREANYFSSLRRHPVLTKYPAKCYGYSESDEPMRFLRGIFPGMPRSICNLNRFRSSCYLTLYSGWRNPFISAATAQQKNLFFSFIGRSSASVRRRLFNIDFGRDDVFIENASYYKHWATSGTDRVEAQKRYSEVCARSRFVLWPRGASPSSIRLFEVMEMSCVPVILSDRWMPPSGPNWSQFSVTIREKDVENLVPILSKYESQCEAMSHCARKNWEDHFAPEKQFNFVVDSIAAIDRTSRLNERIFRAMWPVMLFRRKFIRPRSWWQWGTEQLRHWTNTYFGRSIAE
jgi:hypothetical protein